MRHLTMPLALVAICCVGAGALACLWDSDTLQMERRRFPDALELITGKFLRHSPAYYRWRVDDRRRRIEAGETDPDVYDDLAVGYDKLGEHGKAIETILKKEELHPGEYETYANLGTFYIHNGELRRGIEQIERAIAINPDAHFGREVYQKLLVEYVISKRTDGKLSLPLDHGERGWPIDEGFSGHLREAGLLEQGKDANVRLAVKGILGMMRFGHFDSPILLETLGDLLSTLPHDHDAKQLAARAYLKASYEVDDASARQAYRKIAEAVLEGQVKMDLPELEKQFQFELSEADVWFASLAADEQAWIQEERNLDIEFASKYYGNEPSLGEEARINWTTGLAVFAVMGLFGLLCVLARRRFVRRDAKAAAKAKVL